MSDRILELFGTPAGQPGAKWAAIVTAQECPFLRRSCIKVRKSQPEISIGTCTVEYGTANEPILICPYRLLERQQVFTDCLHLLTLHEPGNEIHLVSELAIPGGSVDYFVVSARDGKVVDFVGIELQTLDTTGTVWPERQRFLHAMGVPTDQRDRDSKKPYGMNWKMTAKTILVQLHHKIETFEHVNKRLVLIIQDRLLSYMQGEFSLAHLRAARLGDSLHIHAYALAKSSQNWRLRLDSRLSTDAAGLAKCLGLQASPQVELQEMLDMLTQKISGDTLLTIGPSA
ncbi:MAG TPA: NotI family restriction endonuclease [Fimbriimonadaceae bacterium]|nr:NotI family restriction endonuclease [Fimbriimonadaceae bacterium]HRJ95262.1 NotI family restriction endonuclease [Fimbriimonadaceae bacterium]